MYRIIFDDESIFEGGNPENSNWNNMPNKPIVGLYYNYLGKQINLKNYESYNHLIKYVFRMDNQQKVVAAVIIMGLEKYGRVKRFIFDLIKKQLIVDEVPLNQEYNNKPVSGWKIGITSKNPIYKII